MRKIIISCSVFVILIVAAFFLIHNRKSSNLKKVRLAEVTHSVFYAPQYVAKELGYFEEEGIDLEIILTSGVKKNDNKFLCLCFL